MVLIIKGKKEKSFLGDDGAEISYYWYVALDKTSGMIKKFGSTDGSHEINKEYDILLEQDMNSQGKSILKEFVQEEI